MSIINDALKKTQQIREREKDRSMHAAEKAAERESERVLEKIQEESLYTALPELITSAPNAKSMIMQKMGFLFGWKKGSYIAGFILLAILSFTSYQHVKHTSAPVVQTAMNQEKLTFSGVLVADDGKIAVINKQSYRLGDSVKGMKILAIHHDSVDLQHNDKVVQLQAGASYML